MTRISVEKITATPDAVTKNAERAITVKELKSALQIKKLTLEGQLRAPTQAEGVANMKGNRAARPGLAKDQRIENPEESVGLNAGMTRDEIQGQLNMVAEVLRLLEGDIGSQRSAILQIRSLANGPILFSQHQLDMLSDTLTEKV